MIDLIIFSVAANRYALKIENVQRIIQSKPMTAIPNAHKYIEGMMSYEDKVIKILSFRKLIGMQTYESELVVLFKDLKHAHSEWVEALRLSIETGVEFTKTFDPHACGLGKWIDSFTAYDDIVVEILNELIDYHKQLHLSGANALEISKENPQQAQEMLETKIMNIYKHTMGSLEKFTQELDLVSDSLQKFIIYDDKDALFAIKIDTIEDIAHVRESDLLASVEDESENEFLSLDGVLDLEGVLINVIKTVNIPT